MKKITTICAILSLSFNARSESLNEAPEGQRQIVINAVIIIVIYLASAFILKVIKGIQEYRLKSKMIEKGLSEVVVGQFLKPSDQEARNQTIRAFFILTGIGVGLVASVFYALSLITAIAVISLALAAAFLAYYTYLKKTT